MIPAKFIRTAQMTAMEKSFDRVADVYDETRRMPPEAVAQIMDNIAREVDPSGGTVIELGIGTGRIAVPLAERGFRVVGVDIAQKMLSRLCGNLADGRGAIHAVRGDVTALPFAAGSFSAAIAVHVFHLLDDVEACVGETRRVLAPGGPLLFGGEQRLFRYMQETLRKNYGVTEDLVGMLAAAGVKLPDQADVERAVSESVRRLGGGFKRLSPVEWESEITCAEIAGRIEERTASYLWEVSEDAMKGLVKKLRSLFAARVGPPDTPIRFKRRFNMSCARF